MQHQEGQQQFAQQNIQNQQFKQMTTPQSQQPKLLQNQFGQNQQQFGQSGQQFIQQQQQQMQGQQGFAVGKGQQTQFINNQQNQVIISDRVFRRG